MKKLILPIIALGTFLLGSPLEAAAQTGAIQKKESGRTATPSVTPLREGIIMRNGKMMLILPKGYGALSQDRTFPNGAKLQPSGLLITASGENIQLNEGDRVDLKGNLSRSPVILEKSTTILGDTAGFGKELLQAQQQMEHLILLQRKQAILEKRNEVLEAAAKSKTKSDQLQKMDADLAQIKAQLAAENKKQ